MLVQGVSSLTKKWHNVSSHGPNQGEERKPNSVWLKFSGISQKTIHSTQHRQRKTFEGVFCL